MASVSKTFGDAASYLDNARISLEEDYDLVFEKTMRENKAIYELLYPEGEEDSLDYNDWIDETSTSIISKFKGAFGQVPSSKYTSADRGNSKAGHLEFSHVYIFIYSCFDVQNIGNMTLGKFKLA